MAVAKITGQGLVSIAVLVALLWTCIIGERVISRRASAANEQTLRAMRALRIKILRAPATAPALPSHRRPRTL